MSVSGITEGRSKESHRGHTKLPHWVHASRLVLVPSQKLLDALYEPMCGVIRAYEPTGAQITSHIMIQVGQDISRLEEALVRH